MANFKVGQRVRVIGCDPQSECARKGAVGREAVVTAIPSKLIVGWEHWLRSPQRADCDIRVDGERCDWIACFPYLAPLTDPKADEFIERIKKLKPYDEPKVEPQREHVGSPSWPTARYEGITIVQADNGFFAWRDGEWVRIDPI